MNIDTAPEVIILTPDTDYWIWKEFDPVIAALMEQGGVVIDVQYADAAPDEDAQ